MTKTTTAPPTPILMPPAARPAPAPRRLSRRALRRAAAALLGLACLTLVGAVAAGYAIASPARARVGPPPADLAAAGAREIAFANPWGDTLRGWFVPGRPGGGAVLLMHGIRGNRRTMLDRARALHAAGFATLSFDFQAHGESGGGGMTFGAHESGDARAALARLRALAPGERVGVIGVSLGGVASLIGPTPLDVDALVIESVFPTIEDAVDDRMRTRLGPAGPLLSPLLLLQLRPRLGIDPASLRPIDRIPLVRAPLFVLSGTADRYTTIAESRALYERAPEPKASWWIEGAGHEDLHDFVPAEYERRVGAFLERELRKGK